MTELYHAPNTRATDDLAAASVFTELIQTFGGAFNALLQAAMSNPVIGMAVVLWFNSLLVQKNLVDKNTGLLVGIIVTTGAGVAVTSEVIQDFSDFLNIAGSKGNPSIFTPSAQTIVFGNANSNDLSPILSVLANKAKS